MANELTDAEKMAKFETHLENLMIMVTKMDAKIDSWQANFVSKELLEEKLKARDKEIDNLNRKFTNIDSEKTTNKNTLPLWFAAFIAAAALIVSLWPK